MRGTKCLVTGGAGFIGSHLVERLVSEGAHVTVLDDFSSGFRQNLAHIDNKYLTIIEGSITDPKAVDEALKDRSRVFHLAARPSVSRSVEDPIGTNEINVTGTLLLLEKSKKAKVDRFVFTSSSSVYGDTPTLPKAEPMAGAVLSPYALQKWTGETYVRLYHSLYDFPGISLRPFNIFGPRQNAKSQYAAVIPRFFTNAFAGEPLPINGDGGQTRDFTYVGNMVDAFLLAGFTQNKAALGQSFNSGAGGQTSVKTLAETIIQLTGSKSTIAYGPARPGDIRDSFASLEKAKSLLGYQPKVNFRAGLELLAEHFRKTRA